MTTDCSALSGSAKEQCELSRNDAPPLPYRTAVEAPAAAVYSLPPQPISDAATVVIIGWILGACVVAFVAHHRRRNAAVWGVAALLISPLLAYAAIVAIPNGEK